MTHYFDLFCYGEWVPAMERCVEEQMAHLSLFDIGTASLLGSPVLTSIFSTAKEVNYCKGLKTAIQQLAL